MSVHQSVAGIATQYYKIASLESVTYSIFSAKETSPDQVLLELELQIRHEHPRILLTYNNKCLYYFRFGHWMAPPVDQTGPNGSGSHGNTSEHTSGNLQLDALYPQLSLKLENSVPVEKLANPAPNIAKSRASASAAKEEAARDEYLAYASLSFIKALKKALVYNMAAQADMHLFGNYLVGRVPGTSGQYRVIQTDPVLLANGSVLVSVTQRDRLPLFHSNTLNLDHVTPDFASCFVIYVVPSGLRCHLYDTHNLPLSFTSTPPKSSATLLRLLKSSTGVDLTQKPSVLWVKLIPNLQHLNNQTSDISRFIHEVDNRKYILWPWELCVLQFGSVENVGVGQPPMSTSASTSASAPTAAASSSLDPLALINDYLSYSLSFHDGGSPSKPSSVNSNSTWTPPHVPRSWGLAPSFSIPSANSGRISGDEYGGY
ncbi:hypothetical protein JCM33374_g3987 [Metschnikowia sp. JCM 33374]|nr:hypothetical protein JCM33374_g3987 [Metschnikowia sp. JCM 33374]